MSKDDGIGGLPDLPNVWGEAITFTGIRFVQRWLPDAFGGCPDIRGVIIYRVLKETWDDGGKVPMRTITAAEIVQTEHA